MDKTLVECIRKSQGGGGTPESIHRMCGESNPELIKSSLATAADVESHCRQNMTLYSVRESKPDRQKKKNKKNKKKNKRIVTISLAKEKRKPRWSTRWIHVKKFLAYFARYYFSF